MKLSQFHYKIEHADPSLIDLNLTIDSIIQ